MADPTKPRFRCSVCKQEWDTYATTMMHCRQKAECRDQGAIAEAVEVTSSSRSNMTPEEHQKWLQEQAARIIEQSQISSNGRKSEPKAKAVEPEPEKEEEIVSPGWPKPVQSMAQQAATQLLPDWVDEEGVELPILPEDYQPPEREVSAIQLIARGQAIVLDAIEIVAYEAWCREGWEGTLKQWVSECITGYLNFLGVEIIGFATPQPQREYLLAKAGLRDAT